MGDVLPFRELVKKPKRSLAVRPDPAYCPDRVMSGEQDPDLGKPSDSQFQAPDDDPA